MGFSGGSVVKNPPAKQETQVQSVGWEDPLEKEMAIYPSILAWKMQWTEEPGGLQTVALQKLDMTEQLNNNKQRSSCMKDKKKGQIFFFIMNPITHMSKVIYNPSV